MPDSSNFYTLTYGNFAHPILAEIRQETYGEDIGQNSWLTADEYRHFIGWLKLNASSQVLDIGNGSGGPALFLGRTVREVRKYLKDSTVLLEQEVKSAWKQAVQELGWK